MRMDQVGARTEKGSPSEKADEDYFDMRLDFITQDQQNSD